MIIISYLCNNTVQKNKDIMLNQEAKFFSNNQNIAKIISNILEDEDKTKVNNLFKKQNFPDIDAFIDRGYTYTRSCKILSYYILGFKEDFGEKIYYLNKNLGDELKTVEPFITTSPKFLWNHLVDLIEIRDVTTPNIKNEHEIPIKIFNRLKRGDFIPMLINFLVMDYRQLVYDILVYFDKNKIYGATETFIDVGKNVLDGKKYYKDNGQFDIKKAGRFSEDLHFGSINIEYEKIEILKNKKRNQDIQRSTSCDDSNSFDGMDNVLIL